VQQNKSKSKKRVSAQEGRGSGEGLGSSAEERVPLWVGRHITDNHAACVCA
jgi:hypothetical protein